MIQNVNFATNADMAKTFLDDNHVRYAVAPPGATRSSTPNTSSAPA